MNSLDIAFKLAPDIPERWERSYRHLLAALDAYLDSGSDDRLESLRIADLEILNEAMRLVYGAMTGTASEAVRYRYLASTPEAVPAWKKAARVGRSFAGLRERYRPAALIRPERDVCSFHSSALLRSYARQRGIKPVLMSHGDWFARASAADLAGAPGLTAEQGDALAGATRAAFEVAGVVAAFDEPAVRASYNRLITWTNFHRAHLGRKAKQLPLEFWSGTMGFPLHRIFAQAVLEKGGHVVGFDHGSGSGMFDSDNQARHELGYVDRFITFAPKMAEGLRLNARKCGPRFSRALIEPLAEPRSAPPSVMLTRRPAKAIYVAAQYYGDKFISPPFCDNERLIDWQRRLLQALKRAGLNVAIKPHPEDTQEPAQVLSRELGLDIVKGHFEALDWSDTIFVFDTLLSSAFSAALASGLPMILFDIPHIKRRPEADAILRDRVVVAPVWYGAQSRIQTDWDKLETVLDQAVTLHDGAVLRDYYGVAPRGATAREG